MIAMASREFDISESGVTEASLLGQVQTELESYGYEPVICGVNLIYENTLHTYCIRGVWYHNLIILNTILFIYLSCPLVFFHSKQ